MLLFFPIVFPTNKQTSRKNTHQFKNRSPTNPTDPKPNCKKPDKPSSNSIKARENQQERRIKANTFNDYSLQRKESKKGGRDLHKTKARATPYLFILNSNFQKTSLRKLQKEKVQHLRLPAKHPKPKNTEPFPREKVREFP